MMRYIAFNEILKPVKTTKLFQIWNGIKLKVKSSMLANFDSLAALGFRIPFGDFLFYPDTQMHDTHR